MLFNTIFTFLWAVAFVAAFPFSLPKWQSPRRNVEATQVEPQASQAASSPAPAQGGFCGWVAVEVPADEQSDQQIENQVGQQTGPQAQDQKHNQPSAPSETLAPGVHWTWDTSALGNIEPVAPKEDSQMYYGVSGK